MIDQGNLRKSKPKKSHKPNKKETTIELGNPCGDSEIPEWLQEFRENLVDDEIPFQGGSHASSSHEVSLDPILKSVKTVFMLISLTEIARFAWGLKLQGSRAEDAMAKPYLVLKNLVTWYQITRSWATIANLETITDMQSWCRTWPLNGSKHIRAKHKLQETQRSLQKFLEPKGKPQVIYTDTSSEFGKVCEDLSWNHCTSTPYRAETNGIAERAVRRVEEGTSAVLLQSGLNEN